MLADFIYLASASPRRRELLAQIGVPFRTVSAPVEEAVLGGESADRYVTRLAAAKADAGWQASGPLGARPVLAADTAVVMDGRIFGKPANREDGTRMLRALSARTHCVLTAVALRTTSGTRLKLSASEVSFRPISEAECDAYWDTGEPRDKAGAYAIQGLAAVYVAELRGSYSGVMGLPLFETAELLDAAGAARWCKS